MSKKNKKKKSKGKVKVYEVNMNVDVEDLAESLLFFDLDQSQKEDFQDAIDEWMKDPVETRGTRPRLVREKMTGAEFFKDIILKGISMAHPTGNTGALRRTKSVTDILDLAIEKNDGILKVMEEDFKYMLSSLNKAEKWNNTEDIAIGVLLIADALTDAENKAAKKASSNEEIEDADPAEDDF